MKHILNDYEFEQSIMTLFYDNLSVNIEKSCSILYDKAYRHITLFLSDDIQNQNSIYVIISQRIYIFTVFQHHTNHSIGNMGLNPKLNLNTNSSLIELVMQLQNRVELKSELECNLTPPLVEVLISIIPNFLCRLETTIGDAT